MSTDEFLELLTSIEADSTEKLEAMYHPSLRFQLQDCISVDDFIQLDFEQEERCRIPNVNGKVRISQYLVEQNGSSLSASELLSRRRGVLCGHVSVNMIGGTIHFSCFSYVHPEVWFEGVCQNSCHPTHINGTLSDTGIAELYAWRDGDIIKVYDKRDPNLWAEFTIK